MMGGIYGRRFTRGRTGVSHPPTAHAHNSLTTTPPLEPCLPLCRAAATPGGADRPELGSRHSIVDASALSSLLVGGGKARRDYSPGTQGKWSGMPW